MIIELRAKNCYIFSEGIRFSMYADMNDKKLAANVHRKEQADILKVAGIYGPNNVGKTCLLKCIKSLKQILQNKPTELTTNIFNDNDVCELGVTFMENERIFSYDFCYDTAKKEFPYEKFTEIVRDGEAANEKICWVRDTMHGEYVYEDETLTKLMPVLAKGSLLLHLLDTTAFPLLQEMKDMVIAFVNRIDIISMVNIPMQKTIDLLKNKNHLQEKVVRFIKNADLDMDGFAYVEPGEIPWDEAKLDKTDEQVLNMPDRALDQIRLVSIYKGKPVPSMLFDSTGTKKIAALASYIVEALEEGRILVIDELDSSIHFKLTRAIVAMFNNELNNSAQMIFSVHDINLMDCRRLLRREQIWFIHKDEQGVYVYSLADFLESQSGDGANVMERYQRGSLGAVPKPEFIDTLIEVKGIK
ncbi:MAG: ATP-binding protein [Lachnospiraceae bacterium]|nr:ATP-binding protein [Lachnospiraceae bacterium]